MIYDYVIVGGGIAGCSISYFLNQANKKILLLEQNEIASGGSGAAGAFLSPLLGKPNPFKELVNQSLQFSVKFYKNNMSDCITQCGVLRLPKNEDDIKKFLSFEPYNPFEYNNIKDGFYFPIGAIVDSKMICHSLIRCIDKKEHFRLYSIIYKDHFYLLNNQIKTKSIIFTTGYETNLLNEDYLKDAIRPIWGQRIDILTSIKTTYNYHKNCSVSISKPHNNKYQLSIGATHHRFVTQKQCNETEIHTLIKKAREIIDIPDYEVINQYCGVRSGSKDYFPIVGNIINTKATLQKYPSLIHGTKIPNSLFIRYKNLYIFNGLGGRGFVLAPYIAKLFSDLLLKQNIINKHILLDRLFIRYIRKNK